MRNLQEEINKMNKMFTYSVGKTLFEQEDIDLPSGDTEQSEFTDQPEIATDAPTDVASNDGEIEVDVTDIVQNSEENATKIDVVQSTINTKFQQIMNQFTDLEQKVASMQDINSLNQKIDNVQNRISDEIKKANPTPVQKLELRSIDSAPFNMKLGDYWTQKMPDNYNIDYESNFKVDGQSLEPPTKQVKRPEIDKYTLTDVDVMSDYTETDIKNSFF